MASVTKRLLRELQDVRKGLGEELISLEPVSDETLLYWRAVMRGPCDTPYSTGTFVIHIDIPEQYPIKPPMLTFVTPVCHPNVHFETGEICLDILKAQWSPAWTLASIPLNCDAANLLRCGDILGYNNLVRLYTRMFAQDPAC
ncbi:PEROXIN-4-like protein [Kickxella alabastrina]|uniref:PEROXIN-4-like protein n=1 Tax=Kickxella alabastrina TaxID=61397 RepID=UPI00222128F8|nr:PEROXIN-4-like protein [Kickxella alabastrina]KAI7825586.1 PEROXIN-4-like protein [Kickxella alabastrina]